MNLKVNELHKSFGEKEILHGISFCAESGKALGLLGRNGAGKTTTIRILMDVFKSNSGTIELDGRPFLPSSQKIGYLPEERGLYPKKTVLEQMLFLARLRGLSKKEALSNTNHWLERLEVAEYKNRKLETLSKGNQQKVQLAQTLVCNPEIIILDEPFSGLDPVNSQLLKDVIKELISKQKIVIFSSHQMSYVEEFCEDIVIIKSGDIALKGNLKDIKKEFGQNKIEICAAGYSNENLAQLLEKQFSDLLIVTEEKQDFLIIELQPGKTKKEILQRIITLDFEISRFADYEPTLTDIFVLKAGDEA